MKNRRSIGSLSSALLLLFSGTVFAAPDGERLYQQHCTVCHGERGSGGIGLPLSAQKLNMVDDAYLAGTIRHGRPGRIMPGFPALSDGQLQALVGHIRSWSGGGSPRLPALPQAGDPVAGKPLWGQYCAKCHGADGSGASGTGVTLSRQRAFSVMPPALNNPGFLDSASDALIRHTVENGRADTPMQAFRGSLSTRQIADVIAYMRSLRGSAAPAADPVPQPATLITESPYDFDATVFGLRTALQGNNFRIFPDRNLEKGLADELDVNQRQLTLRFCNFAELYRMLGLDPRLGILLPCRITVVEDADGKVKVLAMNMNAVARFFNNDLITEVFHKMQETQMRVIEEGLF
ncbi:MAG: c-type cytochrome [Gammaproteobacteria bacterium]|nr:c-type cytochrome [Gammaproteobacteria bacterium]